MSDITGSSTTDTDAQVLAAIGAGTPVEKPAIDDVPKPAPVEKTDKKPAAPDTAKDQDDVDDSIDSDEESERDESIEARPKKRGGFQRRIQKLTAKISVKEQEVEHWKKEALKLQTPEPKALDNRVPIEADSNGKPNKDDFESHEEYVEALTDWKVDKKLSVRDVKAKEAELKTEAKAQVDQYLSKAQEFKKTHEDFDELMEDVDDIPMSITLREVLLASDNGPELAYELAKNREEYAKISLMPAIQAARALGLFEARIKKESSSNPIQAKKTNAPPPIAPVGSKGSGLSRKSPDEMEYDEYKAWRKSGKS